MIRTDTVDLTVIPAVAYRQKLTSGGAGVTILRYDTKQPGIASISKTSGEAIPAANVPADLYPAEAFQEAIRLTAGMPYTKRGGVVLKKKKVEVTLKETDKIYNEEAQQIDLSKERLFFVSSKTAYIAKAIGNNVDTEDERRWLANHKNEINNDPVDDPLG